MHPAIQVRHDKKRGCGFRKPGGIYLCSDSIGVPCGRLPILLDICPTCHSGIKPSRGWTWVNGTALVAQQECRSQSECAVCPLNGPIGRCGLLWIGERYYPTKEDWINEAREQGVSRRLSQVPRDFKVGETWVLVAHRKCIANPDGSFSAGIFHAFRPQRIEYVVRGDESDEEIEALVKRGITPIAVEHSEELLICQ